MNDHTDTVQNGQTRMGAIAVNLADGVRVEAVAATVVQGAVTDGNKQVYALVAQGKKAGSDEPTRALLLLRVRDAASIVASLVEAIAANHDGAEFTLQIGMATERLNHQEKLTASGMVVRSALLEDLTSAAGADGLLDPQEVADRLAGRVPAQSDGDAS